MRDKLFALLTSTALAATGAGMAMPAQAANQTIHKAASQTSTAVHQMSDRQFVRRTAIGNMFEIKSGQLAQDKSDNADVKDFASRMIDDHQQAGDDLKSVVRNINVPADLDKRHARLLKRLKNLSGERFDKRYAAIQLKAHRETVSLFQRFVAANGAAAQSNGKSSGRMAKTRAKNMGAASTDHQKLVQFAQQTLPTLRGHLRMARTLHQKLQTGGKLSSNATNAGVDARNGGEQTAEVGRTLTIRQGEPEVTVRDSQAHVSVRQAQPQITIRQAAPTITIDQPNPKVVVRMPKPDVNIDDSKPQVSVNVPKPKVNVEGSGDQQAQVDVVGRNNRQHKVDISKAQQQPKVTFEHTGQPKIVYHRASQPEIRYEHAKDNSQQQASQQTAQNGAVQNEHAQSPSSHQMADNTKPTDQQAQNPDRKDWVKWATKLANDKGKTSDRKAGDQNATTGSAAAGETDTTEVKVDKLTNMSVYNERGQNLGDVDQVIADNSGHKTYVVLAHGGFLGLFEDEVALPTSRLTLRNNHLVVSGMTEKDVENMQDWDKRIPNHRKLGDQKTVSINTAG